MSSLVLDSIIDLTHLRQSKHAPDLFKRDGGALCRLIDGDFVDITTYSWTRYTDEILAYVESNRINIANVSSTSMTTHNNVKFTLINNIFTVYTTKEISSYFFTGPHFAFSCDSHLYLFEIISGIIYCNQIMKTNEFVYVDNYFIRYTEEKNIVYIHDYRGELIRTEPFNVERRYFGNIIYEHLYSKITLRVNNILTSKYYVKGVKSRRNPLRIINGDIMYCFKID